MLAGTGKAMAGGPAGQKRLTLREAWDDLGWFYVTFSSIVGGPSVLALIQMIFVEHRLIDALQWIVDGYNDITANLSAYVEPLLAPVIAWLSRTFDWPIELLPHWRPVFLLLLIFVSANVRRGGIVAFVNWVSPPVLIIAALIGATIAGCIPLDSSWIGQGLIAMAPITAVFIGMTVVMIAYSAVRSHQSTRSLPRAAVRKARPLRASVGLLAIIGTVSGFAFLLGAAASLAPIAGAGIVALCAVVVALGGFLVVAGFTTNNIHDIRTALIILGGFFTATLIVAADWIIKLMT